MLNRERDNYIKHDILKRAEIISSALTIGLKNKSNLNLFENVIETQRFFQENYYEYTGNMLTLEKYRPSDFWLNDAGFQFKWRDPEYKIKLECLSWEKVKELSNQLIKIM
ncbi:hypothetical protein NE686_17340 [Tissierella carlieri]|uniref:Uncharacterized protein n=1 Tax=Tissierella carlieri TaxID=689904 RepID=A0ABT1SF11_9FIRM|nr:hypothetical protein [Tissierella carlieri]MCQ4924870.1 hypothetical protein [Tissierella carlieri]